MTNLVKAVGRHRVLPDTLASHRIHQNDQFAPMTIPEKALLELVQVGKELQGDFR